MNTRQQQAQNELLQFADLLRNNGFTIIQPAEFTTYMHFFKDGNFGYVQADSNGVSFSTVHKPCRKCGTGFGVGNEHGANELSLENAISTFIIAPNWATSSDRVAVRKYASIEEFINHPTNKWAKYSAL